MSRAKENRPSVSAPERKAETKTLDRAASFSRVHSISFPSGTQQKQGTFGELFKKLFPMIPNKIKSGGVIRWHG